MQLRPNRLVERAGVNAARTFFEARGCVFQEVDAANDYGKDAYVDLTLGRNVSGVCVALQIKSGTSYRRLDGFGIPVGNHERVWRESTIPLAGIVHDPSDGRLYWCDISGYLLDHDSSVTEIPVPARNVLRADTLPAVFATHFEAAARRHGFGRALLDLHQAEVSRQMAALQDCLAPQLTREWRAPYRKQLRVTKAHEPV